MTILGERIGTYAQPGDDGLIFTSSRNTPVGLSMFTKRHFKPALERVGIHRAFRFHDLRHTAVALAIAEGAHPTAIQRRMGHSSITVTLGTYGHLFPELDTELADRRGATLDVAMKQTATVIHPDRTALVTGTSGKWRSGGYLPEWVLLAPPRRGSRARGRPTPRGGPAGLN